MTVRLTRTVAQILDRSAQILEFAADASDKVTQVLEWAGDWASTTANALDFQGQIEEARLAFSFDTPAEGWFEQAFDRPPWPMAGDVRVEYDVQFDPRARPDPIADLKAAAAEVAEDYGYLASMGFRLTQPHDPPSYGGR